MSIIALIISLEIYTHVSSTLFWLILWNSSKMFSVVTDMQQNEHLNFISWVKFRGAVILLRY